MCADLTAGAPARPGAQELYAGGDADAMWDQQRHLTLIKQQLKRARQMKRASDAHSARKADPPAPDASLRSDATAAALAAAAEARSPDPAAS